MGTLRLQHVSCTVPPDSQEKVRSFYTGVLGLTEKRPPSTLSHVTWFYAGDNELELHFIEDAHHIDTQAQHHFCLEVPDLQQQRLRVEEAGYAIIEAGPIPHRPRFFCRDPFGNLIEFTTIQGDYNDPA